MFPESPYLVPTLGEVSPNGAAERQQSSVSVALSGLAFLGSVYQGLAPLAIICRPVGAQKEVLLPFFIALGMLTKTKAWHPGGA
ncbi:hypothetical protein C5Y97_02160 [Blastopirellula marina]|uniref:Uncharacterized protein n=1 Tax=Blastopirellula marina TaxID=124 RepID=A0A2S8GDX9_9BACT|nr:hypothetical protein C5Y98_02160 [Blastopirellula marina]PTL46431.1 hypothetical protein C5Y97_02160 [Blastopirellula marina]